MVVAPVAIAFRQKERLVDLVGMDRICEVNSHGIGRDCWARQHPKLGNGNDGYIDSRS